MASHRRLAFVGGRRLAATAKVITAGAAIMVFVFGSFLFENDCVLKLMGVGLASAILLDATVVPWWLPRWLDKVLPKIDVEGHSNEPERELVSTS